MKHPMMALSLLLSLTVAAHAGPSAGMSGGMSSGSSTSIHSSSSTSGSSITISPAPVYIIPAPSASANKAVFSPGNIAPTPFGQANTTHGTYNPLLGPNPTQVRVNTPAGYGYSPYGYGYGGGGSAPEIAPEGPPGYTDDGTGPATPGLTPSTTPDEAGPPPLVLKQVQYIGRLVDFSAETVTLRTATHGDVTLFGRQAPTSFHRGDLIVAWALTNGYWTSLTRVAAPNPGQE